MKALMFVFFVMGELTDGKLFRRALFLTLFCPIMLVHPAAAQSIQQFVGHIEDTSHAAVAGAAVTIHNEATGEDVLVKATGAGDYTAPYLKPGTYTITADMTGFKTVSKTHIALNIDQTSKIDFILPVGSVSETVTVSSEGAQIELSKADRGEIIGAERVQEMPTDGRNVLELFQLSPGTLNNHNPQFTRPQDNVAGDLHTNGISQAPVQENIDGATNDNANGYLGYTPPLDSVSEFKVVLNPYDASYGRAGGGAIDVSLKSGTNQIHGDLYEYARRPWLDAQTWQYDYSGTGIPSRHKRDQFGAEADGPVDIPWLYNGKDKTFFTIQWEQAYEDLPSTSASISSIPNPQWLTGNFAGAQYFDAQTQTLMPLIIYDPLTPLHNVVDPLDHKTKLAHSAFPGNIIPPNRLSPVGVALAQYFNGITPNYNPGPGNAPFQNNFYYLSVEHDLSRNGLVKLDHNFGASDRGTIRWGGFERYDSSNPNGIPDNNPANSTMHQIQPKELTFALEETHTFSPNLILDNKVGVMTEEQGQTYGTPGNFLTPLGFSSHFSSGTYVKNQFPSAAASGYIGLGSTGLGGFNVVHNLSYQPSFTLVRGRHTIRAGFDMRLFQYANPGAGNNNTFTFGNTFTQHYYNAPEAPGITSGNSIAELILGYPNGGNVKFQSFPFDSQHYYAFWAQDDWKVTSKLTLNLGIRYDLLGARTERYNKLNYAFNTTAISPINSQITNPTGLSGPIIGGIQFAGVNGAPRGAYATNLLNIQPRFGAAYAFTSRTSLRAGFGEMFINDEKNDSSNGFSTDTNYNDSLDSGVTPYGHLSDPYPAFINPSGSSLGLATTLGSSVNFTNPHFQVPSLWEYSVSMEQLLTSRDVLDISYSGTKAYNLEGSYDLNHTSAAWNAQCDVERGGNRQLCDGNTAPAQVPSPFYHVPAFAGSSYFTNKTISSGTLTKAFPAFTSVTEDHLPTIRSWYNSLQVAASHNVSKSLSFHFAYTWSKNMTAGNIIDNVNYIRARTIASNDVPTVITISSVFYVPVGRGKTFLSNTNRLVDAVIGGWEISPLYVYTQGTPWFPTSTGNGNGTNWEQISPVNLHIHDLPPDGTHAYKRLQGVTPCVGYKDTDTGAVILGPMAIASGCTSAALVRTPNQYAVQRNVVYWGVRLPANHQFDASISKRFAWNERVNLQTRLDLFNALNHPNWTYGRTFNTDPTSSDWGTIQKGPQGPGTPPRDLQISGKLTW